MQGAPCEVCEARPATRFVVRRHVGRLLVERAYRVDAVLCRVHATELARQFLRMTLVQGWWGLLSFFLNVGAVIADVAVLVRAQGLSEPVPAFPAS
ncbi:MAG TPA: hypothetical protein VK646_00820 [Actinomycetota bacterium]|nr:hypothetical protein [Actinomycetota bacterium]